MIEKIIYYLNEIQDICREKACRGLREKTKRTVLKTFFLRRINHYLWSLSEKTERVLVHFFTDEELWCDVGECQNITTASKWEKAGWIKLFLDKPKLTFSFMFDEFVCNHCKKENKIIDLYYRNRIEAFVSKPKKRLSNYYISIVVDEIDDDLINVCKKDNLFYKIRPVI